MKGGTAGNWKLLKIREYATNGFPTWSEFYKAIESAFSATDEAGDARTQMRILKQSREVDDYISKFQILASKSEITEDAALIEYFMEGLNPKIVEKMHDRETVPTKINDCYKYAAAYDNKYRRGKTIASRLRGQDHKKRNNNHRRFIPRYVTPRDPNAMDVNRLSVEEQRDYMKKGLCFRCGRRGHLSKECPKKNSGEIKKTDLPKGGKDTATRIRAMLQELPENEREVAYSQLENEGF